MLEVAVGVPGYRRRKVTVPMPDRRSLTKVERAHSCCFSGGRPAGETIVHGTSAVSSLSVGVGIRPVGECPNHENALLVVRPVVTWVGIHPRRSIGIPARNPDGSVGQISGSKRKL